MKKILSFTILAFSISLYGQNLDVLIKKADDIHKNIFKIDTHTDTPLRLLDSTFEFSINHDTIKRGGKFDLPRMIKGELDAVFFAAFVGQEARNDSGYQKAKTRILETINAIKNTVKKNSKLMQIGFTPKDANKILSKNKKAVFIGIENGYAIGKDISLIKYYYDLGVRYITLCHTKNNDICDSSTDPNGEEHDGLSEFGKLIIQEMNRLGMLIDISHVSDKTAFQVLDLSKVPVFASHSCIKKLCDNPRNISDSLLKKIKEKNGVVQICIYSGYLMNPAPDPKRDSALTQVKKKYNDFINLPDSIRQKARAEWYEVNEMFPPQLASVVDFVNHIDHVVKLIGIDYVGIGTDFDGGGGLLDCNDVGEIKNITLELVKRGYTREDIKKIWGENFMRVFSNVNKFAK